MAQRGKFDIYALDRVEGLGDENVLQDYIDTLVTHFSESPEGKALREQGVEIGFWTRMCIELAFIYGDTTLPHMDVFDMEELLLEIFPRKVTPMSKEDTKNALPELVAFWKYLAREYQLPNARSIIRYLEKLDPKKFVDAMYDPRRFGPAKSLAMAALEAGVDITDEDQMNAFIWAYNMQVLSEMEQAPPSPDPWEAAFSSLVSRRRADKKRKQKRKAEKLARRKNRRRKR